MYCNSVRIYYSSIKIYSHNSISARNYKNIKEQNNLMFITVLYSNLCSNLDYRVTECFTSVNLQDCGSLGPNLPTPALGHVDMMMSDFPAMCSSDSH